MKDLRDPRHPMEDYPSKDYGDSVLGAEDLEKERKLLQAEILDLTDAKQLLEEKVERKGRGLKELTVCVAGLESDLLLVKEHSHADLGKLKKLIKSHQRVLRAQDDLKKFQSKLYKLVDESPLEDLQELPIKQTSNARAKLDTPSVTVNDPRPEGSIVRIDRKQDGRGVRKSRTDDLAMDVNQGPLESSLELNGMDRPVDGRTGGHYRKRIESSGVEGGRHIKQKREDGEEEEKEDTRQSSRLGGLKDIGIDSGRPEKDTGRKGHEVESFEQSRLPIRQINEDREDPSVSIGRLNDLGLMELDKRIEHAKKSTGERKMVSTFDRERELDEEDTVKVQVLKKGDEEEDVDVLGDEGIN